MPTISTSMPGLKAESLDVQMEDDQLTVAEERERPEWPQETEIHMAERCHCPLQTSFKLPAHASRDGIRASYTDGVLVLTVEKRPESKRVWGELLILAAWEDEVQTCQRSRDG